MSLRADGQRDEAILVFKQALDCDPSFEPARMQLEQAMQDHPAL
jgi:Tfp pilus assembly protein PilF